MESTTEHTFNDANLGYWPGVGPSALNPLRQAWRDVAVHVGDPRTDNLVLPSDREWGELRQVTDRLTTAGLRTASVLRGVRRIETWVAESLAAEKALDGVIDEAERVIGYADVALCDGTSWAWTLNGDGQTGVHAALVDTTGDETFEPEHVRLTMPGRSVLALEDLHWASLVNSPRTFLATLTSVWRWTQEEAG